MNHESPRERKYTKYPTPEAHAVVTYNAKLNTNYLTITIDKLDKTEQYVFEIIDGGLIPVSDTEANNDEAHKG